MRHANPARLQQQLSFLRRQFAQDDALPFSDVLSEDQAKRMTQALPNGELVAVPGVGHAPVLLEPAAFQALQRFLFA